MTGSALFRPAIAMLALMTSLSAAEQPLTWEDCVRLTMHHNPALAASSAKVESAESAIGVARSALLPQFSAGASADRIYRDSREDQEATTYGVSLNVEQLLYSGGSKQAALRSARASRDQQVSLASDTGTRVTHDLRRAFIDVLYEQQLVALLGTIEARRQDNFELVELRYEGGSEHKGSLASSAASLFDAQVQLKQADRAVSVSQQILARTMGLTSIPDGGAITGNLERVSLPDNVELEQLAQETPVYDASLASRAIAEAQLADVRSGRRPDLSLMGSAGRAGDENAFDEDSWSVGIKLSFPFWSGGKTSHEIRKAKAALREADAYIADTLNERVRMLAEAQQSLADAADNVGVQAKYVDATDIRAQISRQQYEDGLLSFDNWVVIEDDLIARRKLLLGAQRNALLAEAAWWETTGFSVFSMNSDRTGDEK